jgi:hypothetical protein
MRTHLVEYEEGGGQLRVDLHQLLEVEVSQRGAEEGDEGVRQGGEAVVAVPEQQGALTEAEARDAMHGTHSP